MKKMSLLLVALVFGAALGCTSTAQVSDELPALDMLGDFIPLQQNRVVGDSLSYVLPVGWSEVGNEDGVVTLESQEVRGAVVRIIPIDRAEIPGTTERPANCQLFYAHCTPIRSALTTVYGVAQWRQTVYIDHGYGGAFRLETIWNAGIVGQGIPERIDRYQ